MSDDTAERPAKRRILRRVLWVLGVGLGSALSDEPVLSRSRHFDGGPGWIDSYRRRHSGCAIHNRRVEAFCRQPSIKAIVLRIDSPGGGVVPSQEIHDAVKRVRNKSNKAVIASMGTVAASGGYYIAVATDRIMANSGTLTGSIGVIMEMANVEGLLKKIGVEGVVIKSGRFKDVGSPLRKMSDEEQALLQSVMDDVHKQFIEAVAEGRGLDVAAVQALADGRIFTGRQAKASKLVDELGDLEAAIQLAADVAGIEGEPKVIEPRRRFSIRELIESRLSVLFPKLDLYSGVSLKYLMAF